MTDKIVEEIHAVRRKLCEQCDFDFQKLGEYYMRLQAQHPERPTHAVPQTERIAHPTDAKQA